MSSDESSNESARPMSLTLPLPLADTESPLTSPSLSEVGSERSLSGGNSSKNGSDSGHPSCGMPALPRVKRKRSKAPPGKPPYSYVALITMAIISTERRKMTLSEINKFINDTFPYYATCTLKWRNAIRHNLTLNDCFVKLPRDPLDENKAHYWTVDPASETMFENGSFRRRRNRFKREQDLDEILPALVERTSIPKKAATVGIPSQFFQPFPYPAMAATLPSRAPQHSTPRRGFGINDILAIPPVYGSAPCAIPTPPLMMSSYLPTPYVMPYYPGLWTTYPAALGTSIASSSGYGYPYSARKQDSLAENEESKDINCEQYVDADEL